MTVLRHGWILTMDDQEHSYRDGYLVFDENGIIDVGDEKTIPQTYQAMGEDLHGALVFPAFSNLHTHLSMVPFRSLADDCPNRLHRFLMPLEQKAMTKDLAVVSAKLAMAELLLSGTTSAVDMYYFESDVAQAAMDMGFRLWAGETVLDAHRPDGEGLDSAFAEIQKTKDITASCTLVTPLVAPHAPYSLSLESLKACYRYAQEHGTLWTMHLEEMPFEMEQFRNTYQMTPVGVMEKEGLLDDRLIAAHLLLPTESDIEILASRHVSVAHCPGSNAKAAKGVAPIPEMLSAGCMVGLGTDGPSSGNTLDMFTQMKLYAVLQKNRLHDRSAVPAQAIVPLATRNAGIILKAPIGQLIQGYQADITILSFDRPNMVPCHDPYSVLAYSAGVQNVKDVYVAGRKKVANGNLVSVSYDDLVSQFTEQSARFNREAEKLLQTL